MFAVEVRTESGWTKESGDYFLQPTTAIAAARGRHTKDGVIRRVVTWPEGREVWVTGTVAKRKHEPAEV